MLQAWFRDPDGVLRGEINLRSLNDQQVANTVGVITLTAQMDDAALDAANPGWGCVIRWPEMNWFHAGNWYSWTAQRSGTSGGDDAATGLGQITFVAGDDLSILAGEYAPPDPAVSLGATPVVVGAYQDVRTGPAETVIKAFVAANVGVGRAAARAGASTGTTRLVNVVATRGEGPTITGKARADPLLDFCRGLATAAKMRMWTFTDDDGLIWFDCAPAVDHNDPAEESVVFSIDGGTLVDVQWTVTKPQANAATVLGPGLKENRKAIQVSDDASITAWREVVRAVIDARDADATSPTVEMTKAATDAIGESPLSGVRSCTLAATQDFGTLWNLFDAVAIEVLPATPARPAVRFENRVLSLTLTMDADKPPTITAATDNTVSARAITRSVMALQRRVQKYETGQ